MSPRRTRRAVCRPGRAARALRHAGHALLVVACLGLARPAALHAQDPDAAQRAVQEKDARHKLDGVRAQIRLLVEQQRATRGERGDAVRAMRDKDLALAEVARAVQTLDDQLATQRSQLDTLNQRRAQLESALQSQREALAALLRSAYATGHGEELKLLLQQDDIAAIARVLAYHRYFQRTRIERIEQVRSDLQQLATVQESIRSATQELAATRAARQAEGDKLQAERAERAQLVTGIDAQLKDQAARIAALGKDESALNELLEKLRDVFADIPRQLSANESFAAARGRLAWPLAGKLVSAFGSPDDSGRRSSGVLLAAREGSAVHAISHGRIAFADWLRGYGLMIIIDHGDGYLSLYGGNETLLKGVGDWVDGGDTIATSGASGGRKTPGLYFELRVKGQPVDPRGWIK